MKKEIQEQLNYGATMLTMWFNGGPSGWDFSGNDPVGTGISINGRTYTSIEMDEYAVNCKRKGNYAEALGAYIHSLDASKKKNNKLPIITIKGYWKVLVSVNAFYQAFCVASTVVADMENSQNVNPQEYQLFMGYFQNLIQLSKLVIDNNDTSYIHGFAANYSGSSNYQLQRSYEEMREDFLKIRNEVRQIYGN